MENSIIGVVCTVLAIVSTPAAHAIGTVAVARPVVIARVPPAVHVSPPTSVAKPAPIVRATSATSNMPSPVFVFPHPAPTKCTEEKKKSGNC